MFQSAGEPITIRQSRKKTVISMVLIAAIAGGLFVFGPRPLAMAFLVFVLWLLVRFAMDLLQPAALRLDETGLLLRGREGWLALRMAERRWRWREISDFRVGEDGVEFRVLDLAARDGRLADIGRSAERAARLPTGWTMSNEKLVTLLTTARKRWL